MCNSERGEEDLIGAYDRLMLPQSATLIANRIECASAYACRKRAEVSKKGGAGGGCR